MLTLAHLDFLVTMDGRVVRDAYVVSERGALGGRIVAIGSGEPPENSGERHDLPGSVAVPGLINTHHHLFQTLTRGMATGSGLFDWLGTLYPVWTGLTAEAIYQAAVIGLAELLLSGCTTTSDHLYFVPRGQDPLAFFEATVLAARRVGMRLYVTRGAMTRGYSAGGRGPDALIEDEDQVLENMQDLVNRYHDPSPHAQIKVGLSPVAIPSVTSRMMVETARLADRLDVRLHTHLLETVQEKVWVKQVHGRDPEDLLDEWGWLGNRAWVAHAVHCSDETIARVADKGVGVAHCPSSNMRLGSGIAPVRRMLDAGATVGLGVDGSASNDAGSLLAELRQAVLLSRVRGDAFVEPEEGLAMATTGGARVLNWTGIGRLAPGMAADIAVFRVDDLHHAGMDGERPAVPLAFGHPGPAWWVVQDGAIRVREGRLVGLDVDEECRRHRRLRKALFAST